MGQYILLIHGDAKTTPSSHEWEDFFAAAQQSGLFKGGSAIGERTLLGDASTAKSSDHIVGYMRFDSDDHAKIVALLQTHPVVAHGGTVELCALPKS